jgi:hypothetical protein
MRAKFMFLFFLVAFPSLVRSQEIGIYSDWSIDNNSGSVWMYGETYMDYCEVYYYDSYVSIDLYVVPSVGSPYDLEWPGYGEDDSACAEQTTTVANDASLTFDAYGEIDAVYYVIQLRDPEDQTVDHSPGGPADLSADHVHKGPVADVDYSWWFWDEYGISDLDIFSDIFDDSEWWDLDNDIVYWEEDTLLSADVVKYGTLTLEMDSPSGEASSYVNDVANSTWVGGYYAAVLDDPSFPTWKPSRDIIETVGDLYDGCAAIDPTYPVSYSPNYAVLPEGLDTGAPGGANYYNDTIAEATYIAWYYNHVLEQGQQCGWRLTQWMNISTVGDPSPPQNYETHYVGWSQVGTGNSLYMNISSFRADASGTFTYGDESPAPSDQNNVHSVTYFIAVNNQHQRRY